MYGDAKVTSCLPDHALFTLIGWLEDDQNSGQYGNSAFGAWAVLRSWYGHAIVKGVHSTSTAWAGILKNKALVGEFGPSRHEKGQSLL